MDILIVGAKGQLGKELELLLGEDSDNLIYTWDIEELDITNGSQVINKITDLNPDVVINAAAYTAVDDCEENVNLTYRVNAYGPRNLAVACQKCNAKLVQISTDFVFDGENDKPYIEFDQENPINIYGKSKLAGEKLIKQFSNRYFILRTAWLYGEHGDNFVKTMLSLAEKNEKLKVVDDQIGSPTSTKDLSLVIQKLIKTKLYGVYHASNQGQASWYQFAKEIFNLTNTNIKVDPVSSKEFPRPAKRPKCSVMRNYSLEQSLDYKMRNWKKALRDYLK